MEEFCNSGGCLLKNKKARYICSCDPALLFCSKHKSKHNLTSGIHHTIKISKVKKLKLKAENALKNLEENQIDLLNVGQLMTVEISTKIQETVMLLESRRTEIIDLLNSRQFGEEVDSKIEEINKIKFQKKERFQESVGKYLSLYENYEISIFREEMIAIHNSVEASNRIFKEINEVRSSELENISKKLESLEFKMNENISNINNSFTEIQKEKLKNKDDDKNTITKLLEDADNRENKINQKINQMKQEFILKNTMQEKLYTENHSYSLKSLEEKINDKIKITNDSIRKIQNELSNETAVKIKDTATNNEKSINQIKKEFTDKLKNQEKQYKEQNEVLLKKLNEENLKLKKLFEEILNESRRSFTKSIIEINDRLESIIEIVDSNHIHAR